VCTVPSSQPASQAACQVKWACGLHKSGLGTRTYIGGTGAGGTGPTPTNVWAKAG